MEYQKERSSVSQLPPGSYGRLVNSVLKFCTNAANLYDFLCVQHGMCSFVVSVDRDAALAVVVYNCKSTGWLYEGGAGVYI